MTTVTIGRMADRDDDLGAKVLAAKRAMLRRMRVQRAREGKDLGRSSADWYLMEDQEGVPSASVHVEVGFSWGDDPEDLAASN